MRKLRPRDTEELVHMAELSFTSQACGSAEPKLLLIPFLPSAVLRGGPAQDNRRNRAFPGNSYHLLASFSHLLFSPPSLLDPS